MEIINRSKNQNVLCVKADKFPEGIKDAFDKLYVSLTNPEKRTFYGISYMGENGEIIYKAAADELSEKESEETGFERFTIEKGDYISKRIEDFMNNIPKIGETFNELFKDERIDKVKGYCLEEYVNNKDVICMIKLK